MIECRGLEMCEKTRVLKTIEYERSTQDFGKDLIKHVPEIFTRFMQNG